MPELFLGIDIGTASSKAVVTDIAGSVLETATVQHETSRPRPRWHEHDADQIWWSDTVSLCQAVLRSSRFKARDIAGLAVSAIGPCLLPLDSHDRPLRPGILYGVDTRAAKQVASLTEQIGSAEVGAWSGMQFSSQAIGPKILWLHEEEPEVWSSTRRLTTASSYIVLKLTGEHVIDRHTAAHSMPFMDAHSLEWNDRYADLIPGFEMLPRLGWPAEVAGTVTSEAAEVTGLSVGTPVAVGTVDAASEALSVGVREPGDLMIMYGSTMFFILVTTDVTTVPGAWLVGGLEPGQYNVAAGMAATGSITDWFRELTAGSDRDLGHEALFTEAATVEPGSEGLTVLPYFEGERTPINDPDAAGVMLGLTLRHGRSHIMRAILEGVAYGARHNLSTLTTDSMPIRRLVAVGGGTTSDLWMQIVSDVSAMPQEVPEERIGASYGDAFIAAVATGRVQTQAIKSWATIDRIIEPDPSVAEAYDRGFDRYLRLYEQTKDLQHEASARSRE